MTTDIGTDIATDELTITRHRLAAAQHELYEQRQRHSAEIARMATQLNQALAALHDASELVGIVRHGMPRVPNGEVIVAWEHDHDDNEQYAIIELMLPEYELHRLLEAM